VVAGRDASGSDGKSRGIREKEHVATGKKTPGGAGTIVATGTLDYKFIIDSTL
jgi:hypothetical protein